MAACARAIQQADGSLVLELMPTATDLSTCQYVVQSGAELSNSLFSMTAQDGALASGAVIACWVTAYAVKSIILILRGSSE